MPRVPSQPSARLPGSGRAGAPPAWPLAGRLLKAEAKIWSELWATPQAVMWEQQQSTRVVARYCRMLVEAETKPRPPKPRPPATLLSEIRQLEDRLGLTPIAMARLRWVVEDLPAPKRAAGGTAGRPRRHLSAVDPGGA